MNMSLRLLRALDERDRARATAVQLEQQLDAVRRELEKVEQAVWKVAYAHDIITGGFLGAES